MEKLDELINILKEWKKDLEAIDRTKKRKEIEMVSRTVTRKMWNVDKNAFARKFIEYRKEVYKKWQQQSAEK